MSDKEEEINILEQRHCSEKEFHDIKYCDKSKYPSHYELNPTYVIFQEMKAVMGDLHGKRILEYGCGEGWTTAELAVMGGVIDSFDISSVAIDHAQIFLRNHKIEQNCTLQKMAAECLDYPDSYFDIVTGFAILHHLDLGKAIPELFRVMKKGGKAFFAEPLGSNPLLNLYRKLTPQYRTADEKPLVLDDFSKYIKCFGEYSHIEYYLTALIPLGLSYLHVPVWILNKFIKICLKVDRRILDKSPILGKYAWYTIIKLVK